MKPMYREDFRAITCSTPGCDCNAGDSEMAFRPECHPNSAIRVSYHKGVMSLRCAVCGILVQTLWVAERTHHA